eukprot:jgi/Chrpa1/26815/Chrysochromulina_OHIO_Genome00011138-RA
MSILEKDWLVHLALGPFLDADDEDEVELYIEALKVIKGSSEDAHAYEERLNLLTSEESLATGVLLKALREGGITLEPERCAAAFALALGKTPPISFKGGTTELATLLCKKERVGAVAASLLDLIEGAGLEGVVELLFEEHEWVFLEATTYLGEKRVVSVRSGEG